MKKEKFLHGVICPLCKEFYLSRLNTFCFNCGYEKKDGYAVIGIACFKSGFRNHLIDYYRFFPTLEEAEKHLVELEEKIANREPWKWTHLDVTICKTTQETVKRKVFPMRVKK